MLVALPQVAAAQASPPWPERTIQAIVPFAADPLLHVAVDALDSISAGAFVGSLLGVLGLVAVPVLLLGAVSPYALRLAVTTVEEAGTVAGRLYALSTAGSLVGTLGSALLFIPLVGTRRTFLIFALAMDYSVFLLSSIRAELDRTGDPRAALVEGLAGSGRVINAAGGVMVVVFFTFALSGPLAPKEMGVILGLAVLLDTGDLAAAPLGCAGGARLGAVGRSLGRLGVGRVAG